MNVNNLPRFAKTVLKATVPIWDPIWIQYYRYKHKETKPIPSFKNRERVSVREIDWFMQGGFVDFKVFRDAILTFASGELAQLSILDFGAGCGRIAQHFADTPVQLYGSDVDASAMDYLSQAYPSIRCQVNSSKPPLNLPDNSLDVVYAYSVWTHLPIESQSLWLREMQRVLKADGILLITFLGFHGLRLLRESENPNEDEWNAVSDDVLREKGSIYKEYGILDLGSELFSGITDSYGVAVHSPDYIRSNWQPYFDVLTIEERALHGHQDLVVLKKKAAV